MKKLITIFTLFLTLIILTSCIPGQQTETGSGEQGQTQETVKDQDKNEESDKQENYSGNLQKMMGLGVPLKCEWKKDDSYYGSSFVKGKKSFSNVTNEGKTANVIYKDNCIWSWEEGKVQGFKMCMDPEETEESMEAPMKPPEDVDYKCRPAVFTDAKFNAPGDVNFMSLEDMMQGIGE